MHCKDKKLKIRNKYFQKRDCAASVAVYTFMCLWAIIYSHYRSAYSAAGKYVDRSREYIRKSLIDTWLWKLGLRPAQFLSWECINGIFVAVCLLIFPIPLVGRRLLVKFAINFCSIYSKELLFPLHSLKCLVHKRKKSVIFQWLFYYYLATFRKNPDKRRISLCLQEQILLLEHETSKLFVMSHDQSTIINPALIISSPNTYYK